MGYRYNMKGGFKKRGYHKWKKLKTKLNKKPQPKLGFKKGSPFPERL